MVDFQELKEGTPVGGVYILGDWIRDDGTGTFFTAFTHEGERFLIKLAPEQDAGAERQVARWERARRLRHPHMLELRDVGRNERAGKPYIYAVFEYPEEVLSSALKQGPLSEPETRGVLEAAVAALRYIHGQGMAHGAVDPDHIVAVGETVKLATDTLREGNDPGGQSEDVRQLGELASKLRAPEPLTEPLATIARRAAAKDPGQRWTIAEIAKGLEPPVPTIPAPAIAEPAPPEPERGGEAGRRSAGAFPKWIFAAVGILFLFILVLNLRRKPDAAPFAHSVPEPAPVQPEVPEPVRPAAPPVIPPQSQSSAVWRVVAFTYRSREIAERKAERINHRWPELHAAVFEPQDLRKYYLVTLGDRMTREDAIRMQRRARSLGLPRDTYVQNYSE
jgi:hypothetical protein